MKKCARCKEEKAFSKFYKNKSRKGGFGKYCKICQNILTNEIRDRNRQYIWAIKEKKKCIFCGEGDPACLDFHHKDLTEKDGTLADSVKSHWSIKKIDKEISKCLVLCSNCHRKLHYYGPIV